MKSMLRRWLGALTMGATVVLLGSVWLGGAVGSASPAAHVARRKTITVTETVDLHLVKKKGTILRESGTASGTLPGSVSARFEVANPPRVQGTVTFHPSKGGSLTVTAVVTAQSTRTVTGFSGGMSVKGGKGRFVHASGGGPVNGTVNRKTWHVTAHITKMKLTYGS